MSRILDWWCQRTHRNQVKTGQLTGVVHVNTSCSSLSLLSSRVGRLGQSPPSPHLWCHPAFLSLLTVNVVDLSTRLNQSFLSVSLSLIRLSFGSMNSGELEYSISHFPGRFVTSFWFSLVVWSGEKRSDASTASFSFLPLSLWLYQPRAFTRGQRVTWPVILPVIAASLRRLRKEHGGTCPDLNPH